MSTEGGGEGTGGILGDDAGKIAEARAIQLEELKLIEKAQARINELVDNNLEAVQDTIRAQKKALTQLQERIEALAKAETIDNRLIQSEIDRLGISKKQQEALMKAITTQEGQLKTTEEIVLELEKVKAKLDLSNKFASSFGGYMSKASKSLGIAANASETMAGGFLKTMATGFMEGDPGASFKAMAGGITAMISPLNIAASLLDIMVQQAFAFDNAAAGFAKATGRGREFDDVLMSVSTDLMGTGVSAEEVGKAFQSMASNLSRFNVEGEVNQRVLAKNIALMEKMGVSADTQTKLLDKMSRSLKMNGVDAQKAFGVMIVNAKKMGINANKMGAEFEASFGYLSMYGDEAVDVFTDLQAQAIAAGVAVSTFLKITQKFDQFSSGAKTAGELNSVLGTSIDSMALQTMNAAERMDYLRTQVKGAVGDINSVDNATKMFIASSMGYGSVAEMMADMNLSQSELNDKRKAAQAQVDLEKNLAKAAQDALPFMQQITEAVKELAGNETFMKGLVSVFNLLIGAVKMLTYFLGSGLGKTIVGLYLTFKTYNMLARVMTAVTAAQTAATGAASGAFTVLGVTVQMSLGKFAALLAIFGALFTAYHLSKSPAFYMMPIFIAGGFVLMARALDTLSVQGIVAIVALALLAGAMSLVFYSVSAMVDSITGLVVVLISSVDVLPALALGIYGLGAALLFLGASGAMSALGIGMSFVALAGIMGLMAFFGYGLNDTMESANKIIKLGEAVGKFGKGMEIISSAAAKVKSSLGDSIIAASMEGSKMSLVVGKNAAVAKLFKNDKLTVDVNMPDINIPKTVVNVYIDGEEVRSIVREERLKSR